MNKVFSSSVFKIALLCLTLFFSFVLVKQAFAQNIIKDKQDAIKEGTNQEAWLFEALGSNSVVGLQVLTGPIPDTVLNGQVASFTPSGAFGTTSGLIASLYNPPASGIQYIAHLKDTFLGKPAYAQGVGFSGLQPLLPLWRSLRDTVYVLSALVFIAIGAMIMLRIKVSPQAVVTIQNAIPRLITTLILVTFSYAIAGLVIDLSYVFQGVALALLFKAKNVPLNNNLFGTQLLDTSLAKNWLEQFGASVYNFFVGSNYTFNTLNNANFDTINVLTFQAIPAWSLVLLSGLIGSIVVGVLSGGIGSLVGGNIGRTVGSFVGGVVGGGAGGLGGVVVILVIEIISLVWLIKLYFGLIKSYVQIILKVIVAPLEIGLGAFPNSKGGFSSWIIGIIAYVAVFPGVLIFLVVLNYIIEISGTLWAPSMLNTGMVNGTQIIQAAIGIAGLSMLAKLPDLIPAQIFAIKPSPWGSAMGEGMKPAISMAKTAGMYPVQNYITSSEKAYADANANAQGANAKETRNYNISKVLKWASKTK